jgi:hypothetical protein
MVPLLESKRKTAPLRPAPDTSPDENANWPESLRSEDNPGLDVEKKVEFDPDPKLIDTRPIPESGESGPWLRDSARNVVPAMGDGSPTAATLVSPAVCDHMKMASGEAPPIIGASNATCPFAFTKNP